MLNIKSSTAPESDSQRGLEPTERNTASAEILNSQWTRTPTADRNPPSHRILLNHHVMPAALLYPERRDRLNMKQQK